MCTVIVHVPETADEPLRLLAVRDEDPARPWDAIGPWWPETYPGVVGVRDVRANGAWLAADPDHRRLAVLLNRADVETIPDGAAQSRGGLVLESVAGRSPGEHPPTHGFNLVEVDGPRVRVTTWDGSETRRVELSPGTHMIAHDDVDDDATPRIARWLAPFTQAHATPATDASAPAVADLDDPAARPGGWFAPWLELLEASADLAPTDDEAIIRDNRPHGYPTLSLLVCTATIGSDGVELSYGAFDEPGRWNRPLLA
ncbi:NRDE family protein [Microbacterium sp. 4R-513]|uniref:NRDE family protein n=1 Tax=Microbacterium sp. 4R-513 TaxID=2567934 RepID=UPI0013E136D5|nr:NRDE family protein [Microbacterium sp. 4R-513]QIG39944.1 NRDE family protein [Microbacterium sp. 4R-513]